MGTHLCYCHHTSIRSVLTTLCVVSLTISWSTVHKQDTVYRLHPAILLISLYYTAYFLYPLVSMSVYIMHNNKNASKL